MKKLMIPLALSVIMMLTGCAYFKTLYTDSNGNIDPVKVAYSVGKMTTVVYLTQHDKLSQEQCEAIEKVWEIYKDVIEKTQSFDKDSFIPLIKEQINAKISNPTVSALALTIIDTQWTELNEKIDISSLQQSQFIETLISFKNGVEKGITLVNRDIK